MGPRVPLLTPVRAERSQSSPVAFREEMIDWVAVSEFSEHLKDRVQYARGEVTLL